MPNLPSNAQFYTVNKVGMGGLNTFDSQKDIDDTEMSSIKNMVFTDGVLQPRGGSLLYLSKPEGETSAPTQMLVATNSLGIDYMIVVYGINFYLADNINKQWIKLNTGFTPATVGVFYGSSNWNNGSSDDRFYFGNGIDDTMKWIMAVSSLEVAALSADTTITLNNTIAFPASGTIIVVNAGTPFTLSYTSIGGLYTASTIAFTTSNTITDSASGFVTAGFAIGNVIKVSGTQDNNRNFTITNVAAGTITVSETTVLEASGSPFTLEAQGPKTLNLSGTVGQDVPLGSTVTVPIVDALSVPAGSVFLKALGRLFVANAQGAENTLHYSVSGNPEDYTVSTNVNSGGFYTVYKGKGGILGMSDYGQFILIEKIDILSQFAFNIASDNSGFIVEVNPVISGDGIGPTSSSEILNYMNQIYYPTVGEGIVSFSPSTTGTSTTSGLQLLSQKINNVVTELFDFSLSRTAGLAQKLYWLCALPTVGVPVNVNNLVLVYDLVRAEQNPTGSAWTVFDNWNAADLKAVNGLLYYVSLADGAVYEAYQGYQDAVDGNPVPYTTLATSKRFNLNSPATLMRTVYVYIEGIVALGTTFYVRTLYGENGALGSQSYAISGSNTTLTSANFIGGLGAFVLDSPVLGGVDLPTLQSLQNPLFFRAYLEISQAYREHNVQVEAFSVAMGSQYGISTIVLVTVPEPSIETQLVLSPSAAPSM